MTRIDRRSVLIGTGATLATGGFAVGGLSQLQSTEQRSMRVVSSAEGSLRAGAARTDATPTESHREAGVHLGGFGVGPGRPATHSIDGCSVRAIVVGASETAVAFVTIDTPGIGNVVRRRIVEGVDEQTDGAVDATLVTATHTHAGPDLQGLWGGVAPTYLESVIDRAATAVQTALESTSAATVRVGRTPAPELSSNRRGWDETIDDVTALQFRADSETVGTLVGAPAHPVVFGSDNQGMATDYIGPLERAVEERYGGVCSFAPGILGDASPAGTEGDSDAAEAHSLGTQVADRVETALANADTYGEALTVRSTAMGVPMDNCIFRTAYDIGYLRPYYDVETAPMAVYDRIGGLAGRVSEGLGDWIAAQGERGVDAVPVGLETRVFRVTLGGAGAIELVSVPGEAVTRLGRQIRDRVAADHWIPLGLTHDTLGYLVREDEFGTLEDRVYEETVSMGQDMAPRYRAAVARLFGESAPFDPSPYRDRLCHGIRLEVG